MDATIENPIRTLEDFYVARPELDRQLDSAAQGAGVVVVHGPIGNGKSTLLRSAARRWRERGASVAIVGGSPGISTPGLDAVINRPRRGGRGRTPTLIIDDAQWMTPAECTSVLDAVADHRIRAVMAVRSIIDMPVPLRRMRTWAKAHTVEVPGFNRRQIGELVDALFGEHAVDDIAYGLATRTGGNIQHIRELFATAMQRGELSPIASRWIWAKEGMLLSKELAGVVEEEFRALDEEQRSALQIFAAVCPAPVEWFQDIVPYRVLDGLIRSGWLIGGLRVQLLSGAVLPSGVGFATALYAEHIRNRPLDQWMVDTRAVVALRDGIERRISGLTPQGVVMGVMWVRRTGVSLDAPLLLAAARAALTINRMDSVIDLTDVVLASAAGLDSLIAAHTLRSRALRLSGQHAAARRSAEFVAQAIEDPRLRGTLRLRSLLDAVAASADLDQYDSDRPDRALEEFERIRIALPAASQEEVRARELAYRSWDGDPSWLTPEIVRHLERDSIGDAELGYVAGACLVLAARDQVRLALRICERALPAARARADHTPTTIGEVRSVMFCIAIAHGHLPLAEEALKTLDLDFENPHAYFQWGLDGFARALYAMAKGQWEIARRMWADVRRTYRYRDPSGLFSWVLALSASSEAIAGNRETARELLAEAETRPLRLTRCIETSMRLSLVRTRVLIEDPRWAEHAEALWDLCERRGDRAVLRDLCRIIALNAHGGDDGGSEVSARLRRRVSDALDAGELDSDEPRSRAVARYVRAVLAGDGAAAVELERVLEKFGTFAIDALPRSPLTGREREIAVLASQGATNAEIADRLHLSRRTVEVHLRHAFAKLHVRRRQQLGAGLVEA